MKKNRPSDKELLERAYNISGKEDMKALYRDWAETYDRTMVDGLTYEAPQKIAETLARHLKEKDALVADIGCGTGLTAMGLADRGFVRLHGLDFSEEMLVQAEKREIYEKLINADLTGRLDIEDGSYDAAVSSGIFTHGHLDAGCLDEIFRIVRPGGLFACVVRVQVYENMGFAEKFPALEAAGAITCIERKSDTNYAKSTDPDAWYLVFRKN